jgi:hypothetical protein
MENMEQKMRKAFDRERNNHNNNNNKSVTRSTAEEVGKSVGILGLFSMAVTCLVMVFEDSSKMGKKK